MSETAPEHIRWSNARAMETEVPGDLVGTAWFYHSAQLAAQMAQVLGKTTDQAHFVTLAANIRTAFRRRFVTAEGAVVSRTQTAYALALGCGLLDAQEQQQAVAGLVTNLRHNGLQVQAGLLAVLLQVLSRHGHLNLAYQLLTTGVAVKDLRARYGRSMVAAGTLEWIYSDLLGIRQPAATESRDCAYGQIQIAPCMPVGTAFSQPAALTRARGCCQTLRGPVSVGWELRSTFVRVDVRLPADTSAQLHLPGREPEQLFAGQHERELTLAELNTDDIPLLTNVDTEFSAELARGYPRAS